MFSKEIIVLLRLWLAEGNPPNDAQMADVNNRLAEFRAIFDKADEDGETCRKLIMEAGKAQDTDVMMLQVLMRVNSVALSDVKPKGYWGSYER